MHGPAGVHSPRPGPLVDATADPRDTQRPDGHTRGTSRRDQTVLRASHRTHRQGDGEAPAVGRANQAQDAQGDGRTHHLSAA